MTTSIPFARGLVLVGVTAVWLFPWQVVAAQSCTTFDPPCPVDQPPGVTVSPGGGTYGTPSVRVSIFFSDDYGLNWGSVTINPNVFGPDPGASGSSGSYSGTVQLQAGTTTTLTASICDYAGHCTSTSANFTYSTSPPPPTHVAPWVSIAVYDDDNRDASRCVANCFEQTLSYATPAYTSLDIPHSVALFYSAAQVLPEAIVAVDAYDGSSAPPASMSLKLQRADFSYLPLEGVPGTPTPNEIFFQSGSGWSRVGARFNTGSLTTGAYYYTAVVTSYWADASLASTMPVRVLIIREAQSPYGIGWSIAGLQRLIVQSDGAVVTNGDGSIAFFSGCTTLGSTCGSPSGDFTTLTRRADGSGWDRRWLDGTTAAFDANGRQVSVADRYGNQTAFAYNGAGALASITDAAGLVTSLAYDASGKLQSIRDPASRVTQVTV